jgi:hypothetical protein
MHFNNNQTWKAGLLSLAVVATVAFGSNVTLPFTFTAGTTARAADVNANFTAVKTAVDDNNARITALQTSLTTLQGTVTTLQAQVTALQVPPAQTAVTFLPGWANVNAGWSTTSYMKDGMGMVHIRGLVRRTSPTALGNIFQLPPGFRPATNLQFPARSGPDTLCYITVSSNGNVDFGGPAVADPGVSLTLDGIDFDPR